MPQEPLIVNVHTSFENVAVSWCNLERAQHISIHQTLEWCRAWIDCHATTPFIVEVEGSNGTYCILPLEVVRFGPIRIAQLIGASFSNLNTMLESHDCCIDERQLEASFRKALVKYSDILVIDKAPLIWRGKPNPLGRLSSSLNVNPSFQLELENDMQSTLVKLDAAKRMKKFRSSERKYIAAGGWNYRIVEDKVDAASILDLFFSQKAARFHALGLPDPFREISTKAFFHRLVALPVDGNDYALRLHTLTVGGNNGRIVAIAGLSRKGDHVICQFGSIDDTIVRGTSPGDFLFHIIAEKLCDEGLRIFDFGIGDQPYKRAWCNIETKLYDFILPISAIGLVYSKAYTFGTWAKRQIKAHPSLYRFVQKQRADSNG